MACYLWIKSTNSGCSASCFLNCSSFKGPRCSTHSWKSLHSSLCVAFPLHLLFSFSPSATVIHTHPATVAETRQGRRTTLQAKMESLNHSVVASLHTQQSCSLSAVLHGYMRLINNNLIKPRQSWVLLNI